MIKRILVALDPDSDTPVAIRYAADVAERNGAVVVGLAVVDAGSIEAETRGGGIGSMYYAGKLRENLTEETRARARELVAKFEASMQETGIEHSEIVREGVPFRRIVEDMKVHDLLIVGKEPHFYYGSPERNTDTLEQVVRQTIAPTIIVGKEYRPVRRVLVSYDASPVAARALQAFAHLRPFGTDVAVDVVNVYEEDENEATLVVGMAKEYLQAHGFITVEPVIIRGSEPAREILASAGHSGADVIVAGAHAVSKWREFAFGSTTSQLIEACPLPLFVHH